MLRLEKLPEWDNVTVHRAAANSIDIKIRAARGSVCNGLLCVFIGNEPLF